MELDISAHIEALAGARPTRLTPLSGGCVGQVYRVAFTRKPDLVAKVGETGSGLALEGQMLAYLASNTQLPVPHVLHCDETLLLMEALPSGGGLNTIVQRDAARHVADLHAITSDQGFGFSYDTVIGGLAQPNPWTANWCDFFRDQRLMYMGRLAEKSGHLPTTTLTRLSLFCEVLERWIPKFPQPALIHGDLWTGNVLSDQDHITGFIDPAIYFADAEIELAFTTLFGTFGEAFFDRYHKLRPIRAGFFDERRDIYNLYPLLVHVRLFGGSYVLDVERTLSKFGH